MNLISLAQAFDQWQELAESIPADDGPARAESWNDYTDSLTKDGQLCALQYQYAPAYDDPMPGHGRQFDELADDREFILEQMGVTVDAIFVPFSQSRNYDKKDLSLNWRVTLKKDGKQVIVTDYMQGIAHAPAYSLSIKEAGDLNSVMRYDMLKHEAETGRNRKTMRAIPAPTAQDIVGCLLLDSSAVNCASFADWCAEMDFHTDSITHRAIYDACLETGLKMNAAFGSKTMDDLRDLFADL